MDVEVVGAWRYPVKSLQGEAVPDVVVEPDGLQGDRRWGIRDERTGRILTARRRPELLQARASYREGVPVIAVPGGRIATGPGPETDRVLSAWLGSEVSLVSSDAAGPGRAEYFEDATDDTSRAIEWTMPEHRYVDAAALLVLTTTSLRTGAALHPAGSWDARRFRPNLLVDAGAGDWPEDEWIGQVLQVGTATVVPTEGCIRCTMVTREQPGLVEDREMFRVLARHHAARFGVWCDVTRPGAAAVGDQVLVSAAHPAPASF
jgi:uncharacterized protein YcbX